MANGLNKQVETYLVVHRTHIIRLTKPNAPLDLSLSLVNLGTDFSLSLSYRSSIKNQT